MMGRDFGILQDKLSADGENAAWLCTVESGLESKVGEKARESLDLPQRESVR